MVVILGQQQVLHRDDAQQGPALGHVTGINGLLIHALTADAENALPYGHIRPQGHVLCGHNGPGGVLRIAENLVDTGAHFRSGLPKNSLDHVGGHFLHQVRCIVHIQLVHDLFQLVIREAPDQGLLGVRIHFYKRFCRQFLWQQAEQQRDAVLCQVGQHHCNIAGVHGGKHFPKSAVLFFIQHFQQSFFHDFVSFCHFSLPPYDRIRLEQANQALKTPPPWAKRSTSARYASTTAAVHSDPSFFGSQLSLFYLFSATMSTASEKNFLEKAGKTLGHFGMKENTEEIFCER